jgi:hypothetical protein
MAKRKSYWELLKDPQWQRKRLEVLQREDFACQWCGAKDVTLHVHHTYYTKGAKPWEYPDRSLMVLCENCHELGTIRKAELDELAGSLFSSLDALEQLIGYASALVAREEVDTEPRASYMEIATCGEIMGVADYFGVKYADVTAASEFDEETLIYHTDYFTLQKLDPRRPQG